MKKKDPKIRLAVGGALLVVAGALFAVVVFSGSAEVPSVGVDPHGKEIPAVRTLLVAEVDAGEISVPGQPLRAVLADGIVPSSPTMATVLSDENCAPDAEGVSHCTNRLRMDGGMEMTVTHPHRMADVACLSPGERVSVRAA